VEPEDVWKTAFTTVQGIFESLVMQQGDCNAPSTFQRLMNRIFQDYIGVFVHVYLDDIFVFSDSIEEHQNHLGLVLNKLCEHSLYLRADKCELYAEKIECLGHMIDEHGDRVLAQDKLRTHPYALIGHPTVGPATPNTP
jgi:hypothetical protein